MKIRIPHSLSAIQKSGEFRKNGTMKRFFPAYRARIEISSSLYKIRANTRNWEAEVLLRLTRAQDRERRAVLESPLIGLFSDPGEPGRKRMVCFTRVFPPKILSGKIFKEILLFLD